MILNNISNLIILQNKYFTVGIDIVTFYCFHKLKRKKFNPKCVKVKTYVIIKSKIK